jgi:hypothetical protein
MGDFAIDIVRYNELLKEEMQLNLVKRTLFNGDNSLSYDKQEIMFSPDCKQIRLLFPVDYIAELKRLQRASEPNV